MQFGYKAQYMDYVEKIQSKKLVLFGAGDNTAAVISRYYLHENIYALWDNSPAKWGQRVCGIPVSEPKTVNPSDIVVIITVSDELAISAITEQLKNMGIADIYPKAILSLMNE
ncbi:MAG: hypothetical protein LBN97_01720, partial [Oscillospiraceae bacterium]|nr:hypothetical protein [Oscillospiraceae bacterium]